MGGLVKHSIIYSAAPLFRQLISVGMHRLYTGWLGTAGIGVKEIVDFWLIAFQQLLGQNALTAMMRFYFDNKGADRDRVVTSCTLIISLAAWIVCGAALLFSERLAPLMLGRGEQVTGSELVLILQLTLVLIPFQLSTIAGFYYLMILKRSGLYTSIQTGKLLLEVALNFWLIGALDLGVAGFLMSMLAGEALTSLFLTGWVLVSLRPVIDWRIMRPIFVYAAPLVPVGFCQLALHQVDRRLLLYFGEEGFAQSLTGIYGHGYKISYLVTAMVLSPFMQIWHPFIYGVEDEAQRSRLVARVSTYAVLAITAVTLGVIFFGRQAAILLAKDPAFWEAYKVIPLVAGGYVFWALYQVSQIPLFIAKRTLRLFFINLLAVGVNVGLNAWLIPAHGFVGAGITTIVTFAFLASLGMLASRSEARVPFELGRITAMVTCILSAGAIALWVDAANAGSRLELVPALGLKGTCLVAALALLWVGILGREERSDAWAWFRARVGLRRKG